MQLDTLAIFCDLVDTGSFTLTARKHLVSQPAVSQRIRQMEDELKVRLLERGSGPVQPTRAGRVVYDGCRASMRSWRATMEQLKALEGREVEVVRVGTIYSVGLYELPPVLKEFIRDNRDVKVHLEYARDSRIYQAVLEDSMELGIVAYPEARGELGVVPIGVDELVVAAAPDHPLMVGGAVSLERLNGESMVSFEGDVPTRRAVDGLLLRDGVSVDIAAEYDNIETIKRVLELGGGFSILPRPALRHELADGSLAVRSFAAGPLRRDIGALHRRSRKLSGAARRLLDTLVAAGLGADPDEAPTPRGEGGDGL